MIVYGRQPVHELLRAGRRRVKKVWAVEGAAREPWLKGVPVEVVRPFAITEMTDTEGHQGICAETDGYPYVGAAELLLKADSGLIVALDEVQDPQNLGAIARTAEVAGATGVVIPERRSAEVTGAVCKASAGAVEHLRIARVRNLSDFLADAKEAGMWCYGADAAGVPYTKPDYAGGTVLVMGAEGKGLRPRVAKACDELISLPVKGRIESLNVSAAAAALLYGILQAKDPT